MMDVEEVNTGSKGPHLPVREEVHMKVVKRLALALGSLLALAVAGGAHWRL
jgi:hypothetical protein